MTPMKQYNKELYHYGVKGMKWGVRRSQNTTSESANTKKQRTQSSNTTDYINRKKREKASMMRSSVITGLRLATPLLAVGVAAIVGPEAAPLVTAGKVAVSNILTTAGLANTFYGQVSKVKAMD